MLGKLAWFAVSLLTAHRSGGEELTPWAVYGFRNSNTALLLALSNGVEHLYKLDDTGRLQEVLALSWGRIDGFLWEDRISCSRTQVRNLRALDQAVSEPTPFWRCGRYWFARNAVVDIDGRTVLNTKLQLVTAVINPDDSMTVIGCLPGKQGTTVFWTVSKGGAASAPRSLQIKGDPSVVLPMASGQFPLLSVSSEDRTERVYLVDPTTAKLKEAFSEALKDAQISPSELSQDERLLAAPVGSKGDFFWIRGGAVWLAKFENGRLKLKPLKLAVAGATPIPTLHGQVMSIQPSSFAPRTGGRLPSLPPSKIKR